MSTVTILHFNDVYNIEGQKDEPKGGAARMQTYIKSQKSSDPCLLFSGDALNPSLLSIFLKGDQMVPILNELGVKAAVYGNHDFDFGVDHLVDIAQQCKFPWLMSNVTDAMDDLPLAQGETYKLIEHAGVKIGIIGLIEMEWIDTLSTVDPEDVIFTDFIESGNKLCRTLRDLGAEMIVALTHMRMPNDLKLAELVDDIDIVLGGHDHDYEVEKVNGTYVVKSGTDFRNLSKITMTRNNNNKGWGVVIERVDLDSSTEEDPAIKTIVDELLGSVEQKMDVVLGYMNVDLDGRFASVRTQETNLGNFINDIILTGTKADISILNSGTLRSDKVHPKGEFKMRDLMTILPLMDPFVTIKCTGRQLCAALENGVSKYPIKEGRFPQVAGISFGFNPNKPPGQRVPPELVKVHGEYVDMDKEYRVATKEYIAAGKDGYEVFKDCEVVETAENCPCLSTMVRNHFEAVEIMLGKRKCRSGHRQSLVHLTARDEISKRYDKKHSLVRQKSIHEMEMEMNYLCPRVDGRIVMLTEEKTDIMMSLKNSHLNRT